MHLVCLIASDDRLTGTADETILSLPSDDAMKTTCRCRQRRTGRSGFQTLEMLFALAMLSLLLLASIWYGCFWLMRAGAIHAVATGAREAGKGASVSDVAEAVNSVLAVHGSAVLPDPGSGMTIVLDDGASGPSVYGDPEMACPYQGPLLPGEVRVTLWIDPRAKKAGRMAAAIPSWTLRGFGTGGRLVSIASLVRKETP
jgi:hypothetical protein